MTMHHRLSRLIIYTLGLTTPVAVTLAMLHTSRMWAHTSDEPVHIAAGLELLERGTYRYEAQHPPLSRIVAASVPYLYGLRGRYQSDAWEDGFRMLLGGSIEHYQQTLHRARIGSVMFLALSGVIVFMWSVAHCSYPIALIITLFYLSIPTILAHHSLATTDGALNFSILLCAALLAYWQRALSVRRASLLGVGVGLALASKITAIPFLLCLFLAFAICTPRAQQPPTRAILKHVTIVLVISLLTLWSTYGFEVSKLAESKRADEVLIHLPDNRYGDLIRTIINTPLPLARYVTGIASVARHAREGHPAFFWGETSSNGWLMFFPVALLIKTPLPTLILGVSACLLLILFWHNIRLKVAVYPLVAAIFIILSVLPSSINIGIRHILPVFGLVLMGCGPVLEFCRKRFNSAATPILFGSLLLLFSQLASTAYQFPHFISYFNPVPDLLGYKGYDIICNSDFDWGQDGYLLREYLLNHQVKEYLHEAATWTTADDTILFPRHQRYQQQRTGLLATNRCLSASTGVPLETLAFLNEKTPSAQLGETTLVYLLEEPLP